ncbi:type VII toxin-antitoxin system MntA family adenylyltransferase antitoxin [Natrialbaceae archaeon A-arb3/5]
MDRIEETDVEADFAPEVLQAVLEDAPVRLAILFGSHATDRTHAHSDVDVAVELDAVRPGDENYNDVFFGVSASISETLGTDEVDVVDVHSAPNTLVRSIVDDGVVLCGDPERVAALESELRGTSTDDRSPRERFDETLRRIDEHLA